MRHLLLSSAAALVLAGFVHAQDGSAVQRAIEGGIAELNDEGANITYDSAEVGDDGALILRGVRMAPDDGELVMTTDWLSVAPSTETPGEVTVTIAPVVEMTAFPDGPSDEPPVDLRLESEGMEFVTNWVLGAAGKPSFTLEADSLTLTGGDAEHPVLKRLEFRPTDLAVSFSFDEESRDASAGLAASTLFVDYLFTNPQDNQTIGTKADVETMAVSFEATSLPEDEEEIDAFLENGGTFRLTSQSGPSTFETSAPGGAMPFTMTGSGGGGTMLLSLLDGILTIRQETTDVEYVIAPDPQMMPIPPFDAGIQTMLIDVEIPLIETDGPANAKFGFALRDLYVSDSIWQLFDPEAKLPRDPASAVIDLTAAIDLDRPITELPETDGPQEMGDIERVDLNEFLVSLGGAEVTAGGAVTMDNSGPMPIPTGEVEIAAKGVQTLIQTLVELGIVQQQDAGMAMGMMMAFGRQGEEPDTFTSLIEFRDGGVFANGQPLQ